MTENIRKSTKEKWLLGILIFFIAIIVLLPFILSPIVKKLLVQQVRDQTQGEYHLTIKHLDLSLFQASIKAKQIRFYPDTSKIKKRQKHNDLFEISASEIKIQGINLWKILVENQVSIEQLTFVKPEVKWMRNFEIKNNSDSKNGFSRRDLKKRSLPPVHINRINLSESGFKIIKMDSSHAQMLALDKASFRINKFVYNNSDTVQGIGPFNFDEFTFLLKDYTMKLPDSLYVLHFDSLKAAVSASSVLVSGIRLIPRYNNVEFPKKKGEQTDRIQLYNKSLRISGIDFKRLKEKEEFVAGFVEIDSTNMVAFRDKRYQLPDDKFVKLPQQQLRELNFYINIDSLQLDNIQITYRERVAGASQAGTINFTDLNAMVYNITNDSLLLKNGIAMKAHASAYLMGAGKIEAHFNLPIADPNNAHYFEGSLSPMKMEVINPMTRYVVSGEIVSGNVNSLNFKAHANETASKGTMRFGYDHLKIQINNKDKGNKAILSFLANTFIVKSANPLNGKFREAQMSYERDKRKSVINYWWKTLLSGFKETMGIPEKKG